MRITVLGCGAAYPRAGGACSGWLVEGGGVRVWIDAGNGTLSNLQRHISYRDVDALVLSHVHADHIADVTPFVYALGFDPQFRGSIPVWATPSVPEVLAHPLSDSSQAILRRVLEFREIDGVFEVGGLRFEPFATVHPVTTYGFRVADGSRTLVYTADTADFPELAHACRGADLLVCEASYLRGAKAEPGVHLWAHEAGGVAEKAEAKRLVLTHIWPTFEPRDAEAEAREAFTGPVQAASEGETYEI